MPPLRRRFRIAAAGLALVAGGRMVYSKDHLRSPAELWTARLDGTDETRITHINDARLAAVKLGEPEQMSFRGAGGDIVFAYIMKPVDFDQFSRTVTNLGIFWALINEPPPRR